MAPSGECAHTYMTVRAKLGSLIAGIATKAFPSNTRRMIPEKVFNLFRDSPSIRKQAYAKPYDTEILFYLFVGKQHIFLYCLTKSWDQNTRVGPA